MIWVSHLVGQTFPGPHLHLNRSLKELLQTQLHQEQSDSALEVRHPYTELNQPTNQLQT